MNDEQQKHLAKLLEEMGNAIQAAKTTLDLNGMSDIRRELITVSDKLDDFIDALDELEENQEEPQ